MEGIRKFWKTETTESSIRPVRLPWNKIEETREDVEKSIDRGTNSRGIKEYAVNRPQRSSSYGRRAMKSKREAEGRERYNNTACNSALIV